MPTPTLVTDAIISSGGHNWFSIVDVDLVYPEPAPSPFFLTTAGTGVYLGQGIILTAAHIVSSNQFDPRQPIHNGLMVQTANFVNGYGLTILEGSGLVGATEDLAVVPNTFISFGNSSLFGSSSSDAAIVRTNINGPSVLQSGGFQSPQMIIYTDPDDASGRLWTAGYINDATNITGSNGELLYQSTDTTVNGALNVNSHTTVNALYGNSSGYAAWVMSSADFQVNPGQSGSGVWLTTALPDGTTGEYLAGIVSGTLGASGLSNSYTAIEDIGGTYHQLAATLFLPINLGGLGFTNAKLFATHILIGDQGAGATSLIQGTGFNENIYVSDMVGNTINGGGGRDTVFYTGISTGVEATINTNNITVVRAAGNDTLTGIEAVQGTAKSDAFNINTLRQGILIGNSNVFNPNPPQELPDTKNTTVSEVLTLPTSGGRGLSSAQAMDAFVAASGLNFMIDGTEDTLTLAQSLWDAGAQVTYYTAFGEGTIYLNGLQIGYTGVHFEPTQTDFFAGIPVGGSVGLTDIGTTMLDLSGVVGNITSTVLAGISLWNLVDEIAVGVGDVTLDLGLFGVSEFTGGDGVDDIVGGVLDDLFSGNGGDDILDGGAGADVLDGGDGDDTLTGGAGDDILIGGAGADTLDGGAGTDTVSYAGALAGALAGVTLDLVSGGTGGEALGDTYAGIERVIGSDFADDITGTANADEILGGAGDDTLRGSLGADTYDGGAGIDLVTYQSTGAAITLDLTNLANNTGAATGDSYVGVEEWGGSNLDDLMTADDSGVTFFGYGGDDDLFGGAGDDTMYGALGDDRLEGGAGDDFLSGSNGEDVLRGEDGDDVLLGGNGDDLLDGGLGADRLVGGFGNDDMKGRSGDDRMFGQGDNDIMTGGAGDDFMTGETGDDIVDGGAGNDDLFGSSGDDSLIGFKGDDILNGGTGADRLDGGDGTDFLTGGSGADVFAFDFAAASTALDTVFDFEVGVDVLEIGGGATYGDLTFTLSPNGQHTTVSYNGHSIFVKNVTVAELGAAQFVFTGGAAAEKPIVADDDSFEFVGKAVVSDDGIDYSGLEDGFVVSQQILDAFRASVLELDRSHVFVGEHGWLEIGPDVDMLHAPDFEMYAL